MDISLSVVLVVVCCIISTAACGAGIHSMVVGDKALDLSENRKLTCGSDGYVYKSAISPDGKRVAFLSVDPGFGVYPATCKVCLVDSSGGRISTLLSTTEYAAEFSAWADRPEKGEHWGLMGGTITWSPDSKRLAVGAGRRTWDGPESNAENFILIYGTDGKQQAALRANPSPYMFFSPDSTRLVTYLLDTVTLVDIRTGETRSIYSQEGEHVEPEGWLNLWGDGGQSIIARVMPDGENRTRLVKLWLDWRPLQVLDEDYEGACFSPDGTWKLIHESGLLAQNTSTGETVRITRSGSLDMTQWSPRGDLISYQESLTVTDDTRERKRDLRPLWIACPKGHKLNKMCISLDSDENKSPSWSGDCMRIAYTSLGRLYVAELKQRELTSEERLTAGLPLSEEQVKDSMLNNSMKILMALQRYLKEYDTLPLEGTVIDDLLPFLPDCGREVFCRPGSDQLIFKYHRDLEMNRDNYRTEKRDVSVGELDAGYSWYVSVYVNKAPEAVSKQ